MARVSQSQRTTRLRRALVRLVAAGLFAGLLVGCGGANGPGTQLAIKDDWVQPRAYASVAEMAHGVSQFGYDLFQAAAKPDENTVLSPLSVAYAFADGSRRSQR